MKYHYSRYFIVLLTIILPLTLQSQDIPEINFEKFVLSNGLQVILHEDHSTPMVSVNVWYHVGIKKTKRGDAPALPICLSI